MQKDLLKQPRGTYQKLPNNSIWRRVIDDLKNTSSWPYLAVWKTRYVRTLLVTITVFLLLSVALTLVIVNPRLNWAIFGKGAWNTIDRLTDPRFGSDYTRSGMTAMAGSGDWLGLGTKERGLILLNKYSRIPHEGFTDGPVLDVTAGPRENTFYALRGDQEITFIDGVSARSPWLHRPKNPLWQEASGSGLADAVIANELDDEGWLVAAKNWGVARYQFSRRDDGQVYRQRSWQTSALSKITLDNALITRAGVWVTLAKGGIHFANRQSLEEVTERQVNTPQILKLDGDYDGRWATALDKERGLWMFNQERSGWLGPYFGCDDNALKLKSISQITLARLGKRFAWLGSRAGLYCYDTQSRRMQGVIPDTDVVGMEVAATINNSTGTQDVLVGGTKGLFVVRGPSEAKPLDLRPIRWMSLSTDSNLCLYKVQVDSNTDSIAVYDKPFGEGSASVVMSQQGWKTLSANPGIAGIELVGQKLLFATSSAGCFLYDAQLHNYKDCSTALKINQGGEERVKLLSFSNLQQHSSRIVAFGDGRPVLFREADSIWLDLDPTRRTAPVKLITAANRIFGIGRQGEIHEYNPESLKVENPFAAQAKALDSGVAKATGDLAAYSGSWTAAFLQKQHIIFCDSNRGVAEEKALPPGVESSEIAQLRLTGDQLLFCTTGGRVLAGDKGAVAFGSGSLPFPVRQISAIAGGSDSSYVLIGGPAGRIVKYNWAFGSWSGMQPIAAASVVKIQETKNITWARLSDGSLFYAGNGANWVRAHGYDRWAVDSSGSNIWLWGADGTARVPPGLNQIQSPSTFARFSAGSGMRSFVSKARFVWQVDQAKVAFFGAGSRAGIYNSQTDTWNLIPINLKTPSRFIAGEKFLIAVEGRNALLVNKQMIAIPLVSLPPTAKRITMSLNGDVFQIAYINNKSVVLRRWDELGKTASMEYLFSNSNSKDVAFSASGELWALQTGRLVKLVTTDRAGELAASNQSVSLSPGITTISSLFGRAEIAELNLVDQSAQSGRATTDFGGPKLEWARQPDGSIDATWKDLPPSLQSSPPVWGSSNGRLAIQCILDVRLTPEGDLFTLTESCGVVRDSNTYQVKRLDFEAKAGDSIFAGEQPPEAQTGPWKWQMSSGSLEIIYDGDNRARRWAEAETGARFSDDVVRYINRRELNGQVSFTTEDGVWPFNLKEGRIGPEVNEDQSAETIEAGNSLVKITYHKGVVTFLSFDGRQAFDKGRFFFDNVEGLCYFKDSFYTLTPNRAVVSRNPMNLAQVIKGWPLPPGVTGMNYSLESSPTGIRLKPYATASPGFELDVDGGEWRRADTSQERAQIEMGLVTWKATGGRSFQPFLEHGQQSPKQIDNWWSGDRFAWDKVYSGGALNDTTLILLTPLGPIVWKQKSGGFSPVAILPNANLRECDVARQRGSDGLARPVGLLLSGPGNLSGELVFINSQGEPEMRKSGLDEALTAKLVLKDQGGRIDFHQEWVSKASSGSAPGVIESRIDSLPADHLIKDGRFIFNLVSGAAPIDSQDRRAAGQWIAFSECEGANDPACMMSRYEAGQGGTDELILREVWNPKIKISALRTSKDKTLLASSGATVLRGEWKKGWNDIKQHESGDAFRKGSQVSLDVARLSWDSSPLYEWDDKNAFAVTPNSYRVFSAVEGGMALSFDIVTSIAMHKERNMLAVGTKGGFYIVASGYGDAYVLACSTPDARLDTTIIDIERLRYDKDGIVWAKLTDGKIVGITDSPKIFTHRLSWPASYTTFEKCEVNLGGTGFKAYGKQYDVSNDAWGIGREQISNIVDFVFDNESRTLWLCTRESGIFKALTDRLPR